MFPDRAAIHFSGILFFLFLFLFCFVFVVVVVLLTTSFNSLLNILLLSLYTC